MVSPESGIDNAPGIGPRSVALSSEFRSVYTALKPCKNKGRDTLHLAVASVHAVDYLVTWNCKHIANAHIRRQLAEINNSEGVYTPIVCTPEELLDDDDDIPSPEV